MSVGFRESGWIPWCLAYRVRRSQPLASDRTQFPTNFIAIVFDLVYSERGLWQSAVWIVLQISPRGRAVPTERSGDIGS